MGRAGGLRTTFRRLHQLQTSGIYSIAPSRLSALAPTVDTAQLASTSRNPAALSAPPTLRNQPLPKNHFQQRRPEKFFGSRQNHNENFSSSSGPSSSPDPNTEPVSDHEFNVRLGRAVSLLRATLDDFMRIGLVDYDCTNMASSSSNSGIGIPSLDRLGLGAIVRTFAARMSAKESFREELPSHLRTVSDCPVYHPQIVFKFRPPDATSLSVTEPEDQRAENALITFSGRTMYFGSARILRRALSALFSETNVNIERAHLQRGDHDNGGAAQHAPTPSRLGPEPPPATPEPNANPSRRQATLVLRLTFSGVVRVTQQLHEYTVIFRYKFDPHTGMIIEHKVERIEPAPGERIWAGLSSTFARLAGFQPQPQPQSPKTASDCRMSASGASSAMQKSASSERSPAAYLPLVITRSKPTRSTPTIATSAGLDWSRRRSFLTNSSPTVKPVASSKNQCPDSRSVGVAALSSAAGEQDLVGRGFFSRPHDAEDMPGPSLASIWVGMSLPKKKIAALQQWAPASDDPSLVLRTGSHPFAPACCAMSQYRPMVGLTRQNWVRVVAGLSKSNLTVLVTLTAMAGYALCPTTLAVSPSLLGPVATLLALTTGTALCSAAANTINQLREVPYDAQMARTRNRVLPSRTVSTLQAASFAGLTSAAGVSLLATLNPLTALLGLSNIMLYAFVYTPMKRTSIANTWVGAVVGALPPLMGWAACTGTLHLVTDSPAWCLAALLFAWQFPHFNALSHNLSTEYARGGYRMMSVLDPALNRRTSLRYALALLPICSLALPLSGSVVPVAYGVASMPANLVLIHAAWKFWQKGDAASARWCFWVSLVHLPAVMILAMALKRGLWEGVAQSLGYGAAAPPTELATSTAVMTRATAGRASPERSDS